MTFQAKRCIECNSKFSFSNRACNICKVFVYSECYTCHNKGHRYRVSEEHGYMKNRYVKLLASMTILAILAVQSIYVIGKLT